ncbi:MAG: radical SAM/SPASM domain-containing protein [Dehalococcoidia bacterium]|jgi:MoaA/NifB/PqqE/SkfB family radical SAM enzyme
MSTENIFKVIPPKDRAPRADQPFGIYNIELTNKCPMKCVMCPRTRNMTRPQGFIDYEMYQRAIDELVSANQDYVNNRMVWLHHFGESLLHPRFADCIAYASGKGVRPALSINPIMLKDDVIDALLESKPYMLCMSLDGHDDESFYKIRGVKRSYKPSHDRLLRFLERKVNAKSSIQVIVSMIDFRMNEESMYRMASYWDRREGVDQFIYKEFSTWDGNAEDVHALPHECKCPPAERSAVMCTLPWEVMTVAWNGDVLPCCYDYNGRYVLGNMGSQPLADIWNGEKIQAIRKEFIENRVTNPLCRNCEKLYMPLEQRRL